MPSMGMPLLCTASLNYEKMYGDFVKFYDFAVHCFIIVALYCREGQAPPPVIIIIYETVWHLSCRFLLHQFIKRNKPDQIV